MFIFNRYQISIIFGLLLAVALYAHTDEKHENRHAHHHEHHHHHEKHTDQEKCTCCNRPFFKEPGLTEHAILAGICAVGYLGTNTICFFMHKKISNPFINQTARHLTAFVTVPFVMRQISSAIFEKQQKKFTWKTDVTQLTVSLLSYRFAIPYWEQQLINWFPK